MDLFTVDHLNTATAVLKFAAAAMPFVMAGVRRLRRKNRPGRGR